MVPACYEDKVRHEAEQRDAIADQLPIQQHLRPNRWNYPTVCVGHRS